MTRKKLIVASAVVAAALCAGVTAWHYCSGEAGQKQSAQALLAKGMADFNRNDVVKAFGSLQQAAAAFKHEGDSDGLFEATVYMAMLYDQIGQRDQAYRTLKTVEFRDVPNYKDYSSQYYLRLMGFYKSLFDRDYTSAERFTRRAIEFSKEKYPADAAYMYMDMANLAEFYIMSGKTDSARLMLDSLKRMEPVRRDIYLSEAYYCRGRLFMAEGKADSARRYLEASIGVSRRYGSFDNELMALRLMTKIDSTADDLGSYIAHQRAYDSLREKIRGNEIHYRVAMLREEHKIDMLKQESAKSRTIFLLTLSVLALVALILAAAFIYTLKRLKTRQEMARLEKQRADEAAMRERLENELLQLKMEQQGRMLDHTQKENIVMGIKLVEQGGDADKMRPLDRVLKETDKDFIRKLETLYPQLSRNDIRLICLIRLGMPSGEISKLLNITMDSLHKARYRLRKKMGLEAGQILETFIDTI